MRGIDVSSYQPHLDWQALRRSGIEFAYAKASEGLSFVDPSYATHRSQAEKQGIAFGAYHFARPQKSSGKAQAAFFLAKAAPRHGELVPALDLEDAGGLSVAALRAWVAAFCGEVRRQLEAEPVIYTGPAFWLEHMGDSRAFHASPLWIAHYGVTTPLVPGGWPRYTIWQYTGAGLDRDLAHALPLYRAVVQPVSSASAAPHHAPGSRLPDRLWYRLADWLRRHRHAL